MERRSSLRKPIHHEAKLRLGNGANWPCTIVDYCAKGMYLTYSQSVSRAVESDLYQDENRTFDVVFTEQGRQFEVKAMPVRRLDGAAGVRFIEPYDDAVKALIEVSDSERDSSSPRTEVDHIVRECIAAIQEHTTPLLESLIPVLINEVKDAAVKSSTDQLANAAMEIANQIGKKREDIQYRFMERIRDPMGFQGKNDQPAAEDLDHLAVIDKGEFEDWLTTRVIITRAENQYRNLLLTLKMRLDQVGLAKQKHHQGPFGPALLVHAFQSAVGHLITVPSIDKVIFKTFEKHLVAELEGLYEQLNDILVRHGVLPDLNINKFIKKSAEPVKRKSTTEKTAPRSADTADSVDEFDQQPIFSYGGRNDAPVQSPENESVTATQPPFSEPPSSQQEDAQSRAGQSNSGTTAPKEVVDLVRTLHSKGLSDQSVPEDYPVDTEEVFSQDEVTQGLSALQEASLEDIESLEERLSLLERIYKNLEQSGGEKKAIHEDQQVAIDVVDRFFESLKDNPRLSQTAKQHLHAFEIPVLKILMKDESFFDDRSSSVRAVMNRIAQLGAQGSRINPSVQKRVDGLIRQVLLEFEEDTAVFDQALGELDKLIDRQNKLYQKNVERVAAAAEGAHRVEQARMGVAKALNSRMGKRSVPRAVQTLVDHGWRDLLNLVHIRHGENSEEWADHLDIIDALMAYADDPSLQLDMRSMLPKIQEGLKVVSGNSAVSNDVRNELKAFFEGAPEGRYETVRTESEEIPETEEERTRRNLRKSKDLKHWILRAKSVQLGSWIEFNRDGKGPQFMRLVWIAKGYSKYVFVNHQGMKVVELGLFKFATYLKNGDAKPDPDYEVPIVNQGLDDMVKDVYEKLAYDSSHDRSSGLAKKNEFCRQTREMMRKGKPTAMCSMLYIRFESMQESLNAHLNNDFSKKVAQTLEALDSSDGVAGRISHTDFVFFCIGDELDSLHALCQERLMALCEDETDEDARLLVVLGGSRAHLGFNNPESMIEHAARPLTEHVAVNDTEDRQAPADDERMATSTNDEERPDTSVKSGSMLVEMDAATQEEPPLFAERSLEIYAQKAMVLAEDSVHEEQYELVCAEVGRNEIFEPHDEADARAMDQWWIDQLVHRGASSDPGWDNIDHVRVKLSGYAFQTDFFKDQLIELVESGTLKANQIWFDLYECAVIENIHAAADMMKHLVRYGFRFCLDHFGTEQSPFALLKTLPVDLIKIDESYIEALNQDEADETAADSIVEVAHYLGREVLASSVDSAICLQRMKKLKVDFVQGTHIAEFQQVTSDVTEL